MSRSMEVLLDQAEGALLRLLGTVERRGFALAGLSADPTGAGVLAVTLQLDGARDLQVLCRQIERLIDVRAVRLLPVIEDSPPESFHATWLQ
jgi:acetolactate synthase II small subunit